MGIPHTGNNGLGLANVNGLNRVPKPAANKKAVCI
jgi:hypothetical protein